MLLILSIGLLMLAGIVVFFLNGTRKHLKLAWLIAMVASILSLILTLLLRLYLPSKFKITSWQATPLFNLELALQISYHSWPYAVALITLLAAVIITDPSRSRENQQPLAWSGALGLASIHLIAINAANPLTMVIAWMFVDLIEFGYLLRMQAAEGKNQRIITTLSLRFLSVFTLLIAIRAAWIVNLNLTFENIPGSASIYFLLAAALRLGVLPVYQPYLSNNKLPHGISVLLRLAPTVSALTLIAHLPGDFLTLSKAWINALHWFSLLAAFYTSFLWLTRKNANDGQPYWIIALSAFVVQSALNGQAAAGQTWGLAMLLVGGEILLFDPPIRRIRYLPIISLFGFIALPYTPAGIGWQGLIGNSLTFTAAVFILSHAMLLAGHARYALEASATITGLERQARLTFPTGLVLIIVTILILWLTGRPGPLTSSPWLPPVVSIGLILFISLLLWRLGIKPPLDYYLQKIPGYRFLMLIFNGIQSVFSLSWVMGLGSLVSTPFARLGSLITEIVEGDGGLIWTYVFIVALLTLFITRVNLP